MTKVCNCRRSKEGAIDSTLGQSRGPAARRQWHLIWDQQAR